MFPVTSLLPPPRRLAAAWLCRLVTGVKEALEAGGERERRRREEEERGITSNIISLNSPSPSAGAALVTSSVLVCWSSFRPAGGRRGEEGWWRHIWGRWGAVMNQLSAPGGRKKRNLTVTRRLSFTSTSSYWRIHVKLEPPCWCKKCSTAGFDRSQFNFFFNKRFIEFYRFL